jgi:hypothetical protein
VLFAAASVLVTATAASAATSHNALILDDESAMFTTGMVTPVIRDATNATFAFGPTGDGLALFVSGTDSWTVRVYPPTGAALAEGETFPFGQPRDTTYGLVNLQSPYPNGCAHGEAEAGTVTVDQLTTDDMGAVTAFAASIAYHCPLGTQSADLRIRWNSTVDDVIASAPWQTDLGIAYFGEPVVHDITVDSLGTLPLVLGAATLGGDSPGAFTISADSCSGASVAPGQSCTISVASHPTVQGPADAVLDVPDNTPLGHRPIYLFENGQNDPHRAQVAPAALDLGGAPPGHWTASSTVAYSAIDFDTMTVSSITVAGTDAGLFSLDLSGCLLPNIDWATPCLVSVRAQPNDVGIKHATLVIKDNSYTGEHDVPLTAIGVPDEAGTLYPITPVRLLDTRSGLGAPGKALGPGGVLRLSVAGHGGVSTHVTAVVLNVTVTGPTASSYLSIYPSGGARPVVSSLNFPKGWTGANSVTVPVGSDGAVDIYNHAGSTQVIADVVGFYGATGAGADTTGQTGEYFPLAPDRLVDTRAWASHKPISAHGALLLAPDFGTVVNPHVRALALNITATGSTAPGFLTAWDGDSARPVASTLNFAAQATVPNLAIVATGPCLINDACRGLPEVAIFNGSAGSTHIVVDLLGYYDDETTGGGLVFHPVDPVRVVDSRVGLGVAHAIGAHATAMTTVPAGLTGAAAIAANVTAVAPTASTYVTVWPSGPPPTVSTLNATAGQIVPNASIISLAPGGHFNIYNNAGSTNILVDVAGTFDPGSAGGASTAPIAGPLSSGVVVSRSKA